MFVGVCHSFKDGSGQKGSGQSLVPLFQTPDTATITHGKLYMYKQTNKSTYIYLGGCAQKRATQAAAGICLTLDRKTERIPHAQRAPFREGWGGARARARAPPPSCGLQLPYTFLRCFAACFSVTGSFHVASRAFGGWLFCPQGPAGAHGARPYSALRTPPKA